MEPGDARHLAPQHHRGGFKPPRHTFDACPLSMRDLGDALKSMSEQDRQLIEDELSNAHASLAQVVGELQAGMAEIETLLRQPSEQAESVSTQDVSENTRSVVWQK